MSHASTRSDAITPEKVWQAIALLDELDLDMWLTFVRETADGSDPALPLIFDTSLTWQSALLLTRSGEQIAIVGSHDAPSVEAAGSWNVIGYLNSVREPLHDVIARLDPQSIAINYSPDDVKADGLTHGMWLLLNDYLAEYRNRFASAAELISRLRCRKTPGEIERIRAAITSAEAIFHETSRFAHVGTTEREVAAFMQGMARDRGLDLAWDPEGCPIVNTGPDSMAGHGIPSDSLTIQPGKLFQLDFGVREHDYCSDLQRVWYVPQENETAAPKSVQTAFNTVRSAIEAAKAVLKPGVACWTVDAAARQVVLDAGYPEYDHATGHTVGRSAHDGGGVLGPTWERYGNTPYMIVEPGHVYTLELGIANVDHRGYLGLEEMVLVTENGCEYLSTPQTELWKLQST